VCVCVCVCVCVRARTASCFNFALISAALTAIDTGVLEDEEDVLEDVHLAERERVSGHCSPAFLNRS
jgi:hypothetical protein